MKSLEIVVRLTVTEADLDVARTEFGPFTPNVDAAVEARLRELAAAGAKAAVDSHIREGLRRAYVEAMTETGEFRVGRPEPL